MSLHSNEMNRKIKKIILETYSYHFVVTSNYAELSECRLKRLQQQPYFMNRGFPFGDYPSNRKHVMKIWFWKKKKTDPEYTYIFIAKNLVLEPNE